ncbi:MAG: response regulator [Nitrospiraceae bacterium]|nr:response regulator [Nitrospiraceae bacterium]
MEADRLKSQFLASMSHELRTPLNSIIGFSKVMLKGISGPLTEMQEQDLTTIFSSGNHLLNLINDILDQAKIENGELKLKYGFFEVKQMVEGVKSIAIGLIKDKPLKLIVETAQGIPQAYGDEFRTRQILLNLVSNAVKFTPEGTVSIQAYSVMDAKGRPLIRVDVMDTGIGIGDKDVSSLFQRFRQVDSSLTRTVGGTGLGLAISKSLVELQGGNVYVESQIGVGSKFSFTIPTEATTETQADAPRERVPDTNPKKPQVGDNGDPNATQVIDTRTPPPGMGLNRFNVTRELPVLNMKRDVLLIEENKEMVDQYRRTLQRDGFEVQTADHPSYARAMVGQLRPSVVVMDVNFANGQGWEILKDLKEQDETFDIPIVVCTLNNDSERAYRLGAYGVLQRPIMPETLLDTVKRAEQENRTDRILIIDDQPDSIRLLKNLLAEHGTFRVFSAESGEAGISMVARRRPDLIILDLRMPEMDGFKVLRELRSNPETARIPVMVVTGEVNFNSSEQEQLQNVRVLYKTDISQDQYEQFIQDVKAHLNAGKL